MSGLSFTGKVVLVTGAGSTIGSELAQYFSKLGASLVLTDCDKYRLNRVSDECSGTLPLLKIAADLGKDEDVAMVIKETVKEFKKLDVLVNYVGSPTNDRLNVDDAPHDVLKCMLNCNVCSVYCLTQLAHPHLVKTNGNVVNVYDCSELSLDVLSENVTRAAMQELTKSLASKFSSEKVRVNAVCGGPVEMRDDPGKLEKSTPRTQPGSQDIAAAVVFLASDLATFITGADLPVTGGNHLACVKDLKPSQKGQDKSTKAAKQEPNKPESVKRDRVDPSVPHPENEEQTKQSPAKHEAKKNESDKPVIVKHEAKKNESEKPAIKSQTSEKAPKH